jgi:hypothetical protein
VDPNSVDTLHPGKVTAENLREKLSKQLKIDLEDDEPIHICVDGGSSSGSSSSGSIAPLIFSELNENKIQTMVEEYKPADGPCSVEIKRLGDYLAKISLRGGYSVPLYFSVGQR